MAETFETVLKDAMSMIDIFEAEADIESVDAELAIRLINRMMAKFRVDGIDLNYTNIDSLDDYITIPDESLEPIVSLLALRMSVHFLKEGPSPYIIGMAVDAKKTLLNMSIRKISCSYPVSLPIGSGNTGTIDYDDTYYTDSQPNPIAWIENGGVTITCAIANTAYKVGSGWSELQAKQFSTDSSGKITFTGDKAFFRVTASFSATIASGTDSITFLAYKNGVAIDMSAVTKSVTAGTDTIFDFNWIIRLQTNDFIEFYAKNVDSAVDITVSNSDVRIQ